MKSPRTSHRRRRAASTVEFALVAPIFFVVVLGLIEVGRGIMVVHLLNNAARAGCRAGAIEGRSNSDISAAVTNSLSTQGITAEAVTVQVNDGTADASAAQPQDEITVKVSIPVGNITWVPGGSYLRGSLSGQYTLRRE
jgi:Flp pilus assembly protein TadG